MVVAEIALSLVLLVSAALMVNSLLRLRRVDSNFRTQNILTMRLLLPKAKYPDDRPELTTGFYRQLVERIRALPGVQSVGMSTSLPFPDSNWEKLLTIEDRPALKSMQEVPNVQYSQLNADYFDTLGIPLINGRYVGERDTRDTPPSR